MEIHIARNGQQFGPYSLEEVRRQLAAGRMLPTDLAWKEGAPGWVPLAVLLGETTPPAGAPPAFAGPPPPAAQPLVYNPIPTSAAAVTSMIFGIATYLCCVSIFGAIPAVICGHIARRNIRKSGGTLGGDAMAIAGLALGYLNFAVLVLLFFAAALPLKRHEEESVANAKIIVAACKVYATDHQGAFPGTLEDLVPKYVPEFATLASPLSPSESVGYDYFGGTVQDPPRKVLFMSKFKDWRGKRVIAHVDGSCAMETPPNP